MTGEEKLHRWRMMAYVLAATIDGCPVDRYLDWDCPIEDCESSPEQMRKCWLLKAALCFGWEVRK